MKKKREQPQTVSQMYADTAQRQHVDGLVFMLNNCNFSASQKGGNDGKHERGVDV